MVLSTALAAKQSQRPTSTITVPQSIIAPVGGWNTRDALDAMDPSDAVNLDNWFPTSGACYVRNGSAAYATGLGSGNVETLAEFNAGSIRKFMAACAGSIFDISSSGAAASLGSGYSGNRWQTANFNTTIQLVNGIDTPQSYDGTTLGSAGWSGSGLTVANLVGVLPFKQRLFFWENASQNLWYGGVNAITGTLTKFPLATVAQTGGNVVCVNTMSHDGGDGLNDLLFIVLSSGEIIFYNGTDPTSSTTWALAGRYTIGSPVNVRSIARYGADCYVTLNDDHTSMSTLLTALRTGQPAPKSKATGAVQAAVIANASGFGWQGIVYPKGRMIIFNVPNTDGTFYQHVYSTVAQAWCRFKGLAASTFGLYKDNLYFGTAGGLVYQADTGNSDVGGVAVQADGQQSWNALAPTMQNSFNASYRKRVAAVRPIVQSTGGISYSFGIGFDYQDPLVPTPSSTTNVGSPWDTSPWDTSPWSPDGQIDTRWRVAGGSGQSISFRLAVLALQQIAWLRTDLRIELGKNF